MASERGAHMGRAISMTLVLAWTSAAAAQSVDAFPDLARRLRIGDTVHIEDRRGDGHTGKVVDLAPDAIVIDTAGGQRRFAAADTARVVRRGDPVVNGGLIGFLPGYLLGVQLNEVVSDHHEPAGAGVKNGFITGAISAVIGMAIDAMRDGEREVYANAPVRVALVPAVSRGAASASVVLTW